MWYVLAAANALSGDSELIAGTQLRVPEVGVSKNDASTFKPYNPNEIVGSTSPSLPYIPPPGSNNCAAFAPILTSVILMIAMPYLAPIIQSASSILTGALIVGGATFVANAAATAIGSALGFNSFSWRASLKEGVVAALTAGISGSGVLSKLGPISSVINSSQFAAAAAQAVLNKGIDIAASKMTGVEHAPFSWKDIAIQTVTQAVIAPAVGKLTNKAFSKIADPFAREFVTKLTTNMVTNAAGVAVSRAFGTKAQFNLGAVVGNAFASAMTPDLTALMENQAGISPLDSPITHDTNEPIVKDLEIAISVTAEPLTPSPGPVVSSGQYNTAPAKSDSKQVWLKQYLAWAESTGRSLPPDASYADAYRDWEIATGRVETPKQLDKVTAYGTQYTASAATNLTHGTGFGVYKPQVVNTWRNLGGTPYLSRPRVPVTGYPGGMTASQYRQSKNNQLVSDLKAAIFTPIPLLADIKSGLQDIAVDLGAVNDPRAHVLGAALYIGAEFLPTTAVESGLTIVGGLQASKLLPVRSSAGSIGGGVAISNGLRSSTVVSSERAESFLIKHGVRPESAKSYIAEMDGEISARLVRPNEDFLRYFDAPRDQGNFLTKTVFDNPAAAVDGLNLGPYGNTASLVQPVKSVGRTIVLEGGVKNGGEGVRQFLIYNRSSFEFGKGGKY